MRRRLAIPLIAAVGLAPWVWFKPKLPEPPPPAVLSSVAKLTFDADWLGGLSGIEVSPDGTSFYVVSDRGYIMRGTFGRAGDDLKDVAIDEAQPLVDKNGQIREYPHNDAEGIALDAEGRIYVSFEGAHRILRYDTWDSPAKWPSYTHAWRAMARNQGLEAVAVNENGTIFTTPERVNQGAKENLVYRRAPGQKWVQPHTIPVERPFYPVGADFGPDGRLYLLERAIYPFFFHSRIRAMTITDRGVEDVETVMQTPVGRHGNLEGLAVWRDAAGDIRLTMVSDNNFTWLLPQRFVEYVVPSGVALSGQ
ncbi:MAG: esterase-like activity of phytase family protein [Pseudomonadota bacterium]